MQAELVLLDYEKWVDDFKPVKNPNAGTDEADACYRFEPKTDFDKIQEVNDATRIWTLVDSDGMTSIIPGIHYVNREAYYITEKPWTHENYEIELWGHDDEIDMIRSHFSSNYKVVVADGKVRVWNPDFQEEDEVEEYSFDEDNHVDFEINGIPFKGELISEGKRFRFRGILRNGELSKQTTYQL